MVNAEQLVLRLGTEKNCQEIESFNETILFVECKIRPIRIWFPFRFWLKGRIDFIPIALVVLLHSDAFFFCTLDKITRNCLLFNRVSSSFFFSSIHLYFLLASGFFTFFSSSAICMHIAVAHTMQCVVDNFTFSCRALAPAFTRKQRFTVCLHCEMRSIIKWRIPDRYAFFCNFI